MATKETWHVRYGTGPAGSFCAERCSTRADAERYVVERTARDAARGLSPTEYWVTLWSTETIEEPRP